MVDIRNIMASLAKERPLFHSEADFQHTLAWKIHEIHPDSHVVPEFPIEIDGSRIVLDILIDTGCRIGIELKYKTRRIGMGMDTDVWSLRDQAAQNQARYDICKDIERLEGLVSSGKCAGGIAVFLSNDRTYWMSSIKEEPTDKDFRLNEGRCLSGILKWAQNTSVGTKRTRERDITLRNEYKMNWSPYSIVDRGANGSFKYLLCEVR